MSRPKNWSNSSRKSANQSKCPCVGMPAPGSRGVNPHTTNLEFSLDFPRSIVDTATDLADYGKFCNCQTNRITMFGIPAQNHLLVRRLQAQMRTALGNLCLAVLLVAMGPASGYELVENHSVTPHSASTFAGDPLRGEFNRLSRVRTLSATRPLDPTRGNCSERWGSPRSLVGHTLSGELLAPLRC